MLLKSRVLPDMLPFSLCNKKRLAIRHVNRPVFPTTLLIPYYDIGKEVGLRTYQHPIVLQCSNMRKAHFWVYVETAAGCGSSILANSCTNVCFMIVQSLWTLQYIQLGNKFKLFPSNQWAVLLLELSIKFGCNKTWDLIALQK
jgi:hypothetical protein